MARDQTRMNVFKKLALEREAKRLEREKAGEAPPQPGPWTPEQMAEGRALSEALNRRPPRR